MIMMRMLPVEAAKRPRLFLLAGIFALALAVLGGCTGGFVVSTGKFAITHEAAGGEEITQVYTRGASKDGWWFAVGQVSRPIKKGEGVYLVEDPGDYDVRLLFTKPDGKTYEAVYLNKTIVKDQKTSLRFTDEVSSAATPLETP
jgi:hypothetical protein